jgi:hypothetical protein
MRKYAPETIIATNQNHGNHNRKTETAGHHRGGTEIKTTDYAKGDATAYIYIFYVTPII